MSYNRLGVLFAGLVGLGWLLAIGVNLVVWQPMFWDSQATAVTLEDGRFFLQFVRENAITWRLFHIGATTALFAMVPLIGLLATFAKEDERAWGLTAVGLLGAATGLLASLIDHFGTPVLARYAVGNAIFAGQMWDYVEMWRDDGLKTVSFWAIGLWVLWMGGHWQKSGANRLGFFSRAMGIALLLLAFSETVVPVPLSYKLGENGIGGIAFLFFPIWGLWVAHWFWQRDTAKA